MRGLTASDMLDLWDLGAGMGEATRALALLARAEPEVSVERHAELPVGTRDARLLALRERTLGRKLEVAADCQSCGTRISMSLTAGDLGLDATAEGAVASTVHSIAGHQIGLRPVTGGDLAAAEAAIHVDAARALLLERCVVSVDGDEGAALPGGIEDDVEAALEALDPCADLEIATRCPDCDAEWVATLDPARFFWQEIEAQAPRLLAEVAELARHYHWSERDILAMPAARRRFYLEAAGG